MGLKVRTSLKCEGISLLHPRRMSQSGTSPRERVSAVRLPAELIQHGETLHSNKYLANSYRARYLVPVALEDRPLRSQ